MRKLCAVWGTQSKAFCCPCKQIAVKATRLESRSLAIRMRKLWCGSPWPSNYRSTFPKGWAFSVFKCFLIPGRAQERLRLAPRGPAAGYPQANTIKIEIDHRGGKQRKSLTHDETAYDGNAQGPAQL